MTTKENITEVVVVGKAPHEFVRHECCLCERRYSKKRNFNQATKCHKCKLPEEDCVPCIELWGLCAQCKAKAKK